MPSLKSSACPASPPQVLELMALYPQPVRQYPTVEYLAGRRVVERKIELGGASAKE
jgi:hypothetical protein